MKTTKNRLTDCQKILYLMGAFRRKDGFKVSDIMNLSLQYPSFFVGYKANTRINDLMRDGLVKTEGREGRFMLYSLTFFGWLEFLNLKKYYK